MQRSLWPGLAAALICSLAACEDSGQVSDLSYDRIRQAAETGDKASFRSFFRDIRGQRVAWDGRVVEVAKEHGDEFVEINMLVLDLDSASGCSGRTAACSTAAIARSSLASCCARWTPRRTPISDPGRGQRLPTPASLCLRPGAPPGRYAA